MKKLCQSACAGILALGLALSSIGTAQSKTVTDVVGNVAEIPDRIERAAVTAMPWASVLWGLDGGSSKRLVSINPKSMAQYYRSYLPHLDPSFAKISTSEIAPNFTVNVEEIMNLKPDVIFLWNNQQADAQKLKAVGIAWVMLRYATDLKMLCDNFALVGAVLGQEELAQNMIGYHQATERFFQDFSSKLDPCKQPRVLFMQGAQMKAAGARNINQYLLQLTGARNLAGAMDKQWVELNMEQILAWDPEIIYLSCFDELTPQDLYEDKIPGQFWGNVSAVKNRRVYKTPAGIYNWDAPCLETPLMLKWYAKIQHPEAVNYSFAQELKDFYRAYFNIALTDGDVKAIMHESLNGPIE